MTMWKSITDTCRQGNNTSGMVRHVHYGKNCIEAWLAAMPLINRNAKIYSIPDKKSTRSMKLP